MSVEVKPTGRVLQDVRHGVHVVDASAAELAHRQETLSTTTEAVGRPSVPDDETTPFDYLLGTLAAAYPEHHLPDSDPAAVVAALKTLGGAMVEDPPPVAEPMESAGNSTTPPVYTYWGQFIDHDVTANTDRDSAISDITRPDLAPLDPAVVTANLRNLRRPALELDSLYGDGPSLDGGTPTAAAGFYDGIKFKLGRVATESNVPDRPIRGSRIPPEDDLARDLPRVNRIAQIGDGRNDENLIVAQLHLAFLRFHNAVVDWVQANEPGCGGPPEVFARAQQLTRWHYQWLVVHDYLKTVTLPGVADDVLLGGNRLYPYDGVPFMPLEFSVAAYRFGHSMVRDVYDYNRNFGRPGRGLPNASFGLLFLFTGNGRPAPFGGDTDVLPFNWVIEWDRMIDKGATFADRFARRIDTRLAPALRDLSNDGNAPELTPPIRQILKRLATRNLLRGYLLALPTGQAVAEAIGATPLTPGELQRDNNPVLNDALGDGGFLEKTPLWYYVLKEAEVRANGNALGEVGSRIVCETLIGQLRRDSTSYLAVDGGWTPADGVRFGDGELITTVGDLLRFAGVLR